MTTNSARVVELEVNSLQKLRRVHTILGEKYLRFAETLRVYTHVKAGFFRGIKTVDAGLVRSRTVCRITTWDHGNAALWFIRPEYAYYVSLPTYPDIEWVTESERQERLHLQYQLYKELEAKIKELELSQT